MDAFGNYTANMTMPTDVVSPVVVSGGTQIYSSTADPNGVISAAGPAWCIGTGASDGLYWKKATAGTSNNEWVPV